MSDSLHPEWVDIDQLSKSYYTHDAPLSNAIKSLKAKTISEAVASGRHDQLCEYAKSTDGLINNAIREKVWPLLLDIPQEPFKELKLADTNPFSFLDSLDSNDLAPHKDEDQVRLDINRSFTILNHWQSFHQQGQESYTTVFSSEDVKLLKKKLSGLIIKMLRKYPSLNYYQGYHDIASVLLIVCSDTDLAFRMLEKLTVFHLRDFMITDINLSVNHLRLIPALLENIDPTFFELIKQTSHSYVGSDGLHYDYSFYQGLSSILTIFSHDISNLNHLLVVWDFTLGENTILAPVYIYVAALLVQKEAILNKLGLPSDYSNVDTDSVHTLISPTSLFENLLDADLVKILSKTKVLIEEFPIDTLRNLATTFDVWFKKFNKHSVLVNTSNHALDLASRAQYNHLLLRGNELSRVPSAEGGFPELVTLLIQIQDEEMSSQTIHDIDVQRQIFDQQESLANSMSSLTDTSLSSSISSLASSSVSTKIAQSSSKFFKKIFSRDEHKKVSKRNPHLTISIYKLSLTAGFIGFLVHFLIVRNLTSVTHLASFSRDLNDSLHTFSYDFGIGLGHLRDSIFRL